MASSSNLSPPKSNQQWPAEQETRDWLNLPLDVTAKILSKLGVVDILDNAQKVCTAWHKICKDPAIWRVIYLDNYEFSREMSKHAVDRSQGQLVDITIVGFDDDELLRYVSIRSNQLRRLEIGYCFSITYDGWAEALKNFPLLEELSLYTTPISKEAIEIAGRCCPMLKTMKVNWYDEYMRDDRHGGRHDEFVIAIGENLCELRQLELGKFRLTKIGLQAILDGCGHLESLDLHRCYDIDPNEDIRKRCSAQIKCVKLPQIILGMDDDEDDEYDEYDDWHVSWDEDFDGYRDFYE